MSSGSSSKLSGLDNVIILNDQFVTTSVSDQIKFTGNNYSGTSASAGIFTTSAAAVHVPSGFYSPTRQEVAIPSDSGVVEALRESLSVGDIILCFKRSSTFRGASGPSAFNFDDGFMIPCLIWKIICEKDSLGVLYLRLCLHHFGKNGSGLYYPDLSGDSPLEAYMDSKMNDSGEFIFDGLIKVVNPEYHMHLDNFSKIMDLRFQFISDKDAYEKTNSQELPKVDLDLDKSGYVTVSDYFPGDIFISGSGT